MQRAVAEVLQVEDGIGGEQVAEPVPVAIVCHVPVQGNHIMDGKPVFGGDFQIDRLLAIVRQGVTAAVVAAGNAQPEDSGW